MPIIKVKLIDVIQIDEFFRISYRETTRVIDDDESVIGERHFRTTVLPGDSKQGHPKIIKDLIDLLHTPEVIAAYQAKFAANRLP